MDDLLSEKEQIAAMRNWWQENGRYVIGGIVLGVAILFGWNKWKEHQLTMGQAASGLYETLADEVSEGDLDAAEDTAGTLYDDYGSTTYAALARLAMARLYMDKGRDQDAADALKALLEVRGGSEIQLVGRLRLARIYLFQGKPQAVIDLLTGFEETAFAARYDELLGDAHAALGQISDAAGAYERAMALDVGAGTINRSLIQMKIVDLPDDINLSDDAAAGMAGSAENGSDVAGEPEIVTPVEITPDTKDEQ